MINKADLDFGPQELVVQKEHLVQHILTQIKTAILTAPVGKDWNLLRAMIGQETSSSFSFNLSEIISEEDLDLIDREIFNFLLALRNGQIRHEGIPQNKRQFVPLPHLQECDPSLPNHESTLAHELRHANELIKTYGGQKSVEMRFNFKWQGDPRNPQVSVLSFGRGALVHVPEEANSFSTEDFLRIIFAPHIPSGSDFLAAQKKAGFQEQLSKGQEWHPQFVETIVPERHRRFFQKTEAGYEFLPSGSANETEDFKAWATNHQQIEITNDDKVMFPHIFD